MKTAIKVHIFTSIFCYSRFAEFFFTDYNEKNAWFYAVGGLCLSRCDIWLSAVCPSCHLLCNPPSPFPLLSPPPPCALHPRPPPPARVSAPAAPSAYCTFPSTTGLHYESGTAATSMYRTRRRRRAASDVCLLRRSRWRWADGDGDGDGPDDVRCRRPRLHLRSCLPRCLKKDRLNVF